jgi:hypothetical protein
MAGDKDIQAQDQAHKVHGYCAVVDGYLGGRIWIVGVLLSNHLHLISIVTKAFITFSINLIVLFSSNSLHSHTVFMMEVDNICIITLNNALS